MFHLYSSGRLKMISIIGGVIEGARPRRETSLSIPARHRLVSYLLARISHLTSRIGIYARVLGASPLIPTLIPFAGETSATPIPRTTLQTGMRWRFNVGGLRPPRALEIPSALNKWRRLAEPRLNRAAHPDGDGPISRDDATPPTPMGERNRKPRAWLKFITCNFLSDKSRG